MHTIPLPPSNLVLTKEQAMYPVRSVRSKFRPSLFSGASAVATFLCLSMVAPLLITAKHDQIVPPAYSENLVPDAKTLELNSGHLIFLEKPVELASAILSFCQRQAGTVS